MAFVLSLLWLVGTVAYYSRYRPDMLPPLVVFFFGTTFFAIPSGVLGGLTALGLYGLLRHLPRRLKEPYPVVLGIFVGVLVVLAGVALSHGALLRCPPKAAACALYLALCGRLAAKIYETRSGQSP